MDVGDNTDWPSEHNFGDIKQCPSEESEVQSNDNADENDDWSCKVCYVYAGGGVASELWGPQRLKPISYLTTYHIMHNTILCIIIHDIYKLLYTRFNIYIQK